MEDAGTVPAKHRIVALDHIRGLAVFGILAVNAIAFAQPMDVYSNPALSPVALSPQDLTLWTVVEVFFREKFVTTFTLLFGVSVFLVGRDEAASPWRMPLFRRLLWLAVFGLIHGALIWHGDILLSYAVTGFIFWPWRNMAPRVLIGWGLFLFLAGAAIVLVPTITVADGTAPQAVDIDSVVAAMRGNFWDSLGGNFTEWATTILPELIDFLPTTLGLMMIGAGLFRLGFYHGERSPRLHLMLIAMAVVGLIAIAFQAWQSVSAHFPFPQAFGLYQIANTVLCLPVALGYAAILILAGRSVAGRVLLYPLACAGRMAFTNYLTQSLIMTAIFYGGRGSHPPHFGEVNDAGLLPYVLAIWAGQLVASTVWMSIFRYGPFEWVWRCLTYKRWMPLR
ncbi:DUF418 domain-containing protein [Asticcacaulis solisilvae]|uniref:DUF418 domain-containing protein n=1 Tax=Asticcacaulis solisilvae TaxID=1217274 RepID=UPI003FD88D4C